MCVDNTSLYTNTNVFFFFSPLRVLSGCLVLVILSSVVSKCPQHSDRCSQNHLDSLLSSTIKRTSSWGPSWAPLSVFIRFVDSELLVPIFQDDGHVSVHYNLRYLSRALSYHILKQPERSVLLLLQGTSCLLRWVRNIDDELHALIAGKKISAEQSSLRFCSACADGKSHSASFPCLLCPIRLPGWCLNVLLQKYKHNHVSLL